MSVWTIIVAAGSGNRFGGAKQFEILAGERVIDRSIATAQKVSDGVVVVLSAEGVVAETRLNADAIVIGGLTRSESVRAGLAAVPPEVAIVVVHDAARPLATKALYETVVEAVKKGADAAIPGMRLSDTIKRVADDGSVVETIDRDQLIAVQTPQAFNARVLRTAHGESSEATDDAGLVEAMGGRVVAVEGESMNTKITERRDLAIMEVILSR